MSQPFASDHKEWALQVSSIAANEKDLSHLAAHGVRLGELLLLAKDLTAEQAAQGLSLLSHRTGVDEPRMVVAESRPIEGWICRQGGGFIFFSKDNG